MPLISHASKIKMKLSKPYAVGTIAFYLVVIPVLFAALGILCKYCYWAFLLGWNLIF
jgi:hypothetical protein